MMPQSMENSFVHHCLVQATFLLVDKLVLVEVGKKLNYDQILHNEDTFCLLARYKDFSL